MKLFVGISGASGTIYAGRLLRALEGSHHGITTCFSDGAIEVIRAEDFSRESEGSLADREAVIEVFAQRYGLSSTLADQVLPGRMGDTFASGSGLADAAIVCPCSMSTLASIAAGITRNLIHRVADVMLKENRPLLLVPRETPLSDIHLRNLRTLKQAGAQIIPAMPGFYHQPETIEDLADFMAGKILDVLRIENELFDRWEGPA